MVSARPRLRLGPGGRMAAMPSGSDAVPCGVPKDSEVELMKKEV